MFCPAVTGSGASEIVAETSAIVATVVVVEAVLLPGVGSVVADAAVTLALIVPVADGSSFTTTVKAAEPPETKVAREKVTVPVPPTAGVEALHPAGVTTETNVVPAGVAIETVAVWASLGPAFWAVML